MIANNPLRLVFMGTPDFSVETAQALVDAGHDVICVYSQPPRPAGRGQKLQLTPVHAWAEKNGIEVRTPKSLKAKDEQKAFADLNADAGVVVAYGLILPQAILDAPKMGCFNVHASLLPRWRGAAPIQRSILAGDTQSGVVIMQMDAGLDTGDMIVSGTVDITSDTTAQVLHDALAVQGGELIIDALDGMVDGSITPIAQPEDGVTYAHKLEKSEGAIDWTQSVVYIDRQVRAFTPWPGTYFERGGERIKVLSVELVMDKHGDAGMVLDDKFLIACGDGAIRITKAQRPGKKPMDTDVFLQGYPLLVGDTVL